ncbi:MAG: VWA domain-containing protein [Acidobacteriota bacterium]
MATWKTVERIATRILRFARLPVSLTQTETDGPSIRMSTNEVLLPKTLATEGMSAIAAKIGHEVGHPLVFPRSAHWMQYYTLLLGKLGYAHPKAMMNVLADLFVNDWCMTRTPWARAFRLWAPTFYRPGPSPDPLWGWLCSMMTTRMDELGGTVPAIADPVDREAYRLLFHDEGTRRARYESLAELLKERFAAPPQPPVLPMPSIGSADLPPLDPAAGDEEAREFQEWQQAIGELGEGVVFEQARHQVDRGGAGTGGDGGEKGDRISRRTLFDMLELVAFREFLAIEEKASVPDAQVEAGPLLTEPWKLTDRMADLRIGDSIRRYGSLVPGLTTLKRVRGPQRQRREAGRGTLFLVIDTSGSMEGSLAGVLVVGWAAALGARRNRDRVAAMEFASTPGYLVPPGYQYCHLKAVLETLEASGGTCICPALDQVIDVARRERRKPTTLILTDTCVSEADESILARLRAIKDLGGANVVCCPAADDLHGWVRDGMREGILEAFVLSDLTSIRTAIRSLR